MIFEHWIYSTAIAIIAGMIHFKRTGRDYSWIIIASAYAPDFDIAADVVFNKLAMPILFDGHPIQHGDFHNITVLLIYAVLVTLVLQAIRYKPLDTFVFASIGFGAHILQDALVYNPSYPLWWPLSDEKLSIGLIEYSRDFYNIADSRVLLAGLTAVILCGSIRAAYQGNGWIKKDMKVVTIILTTWILMMPVLGAFDVSVTDSVTLSNNGIVLEHWYLGDDTSWDSNIYHIGEHSGRIEISGNVSKRSGIWRSDTISAKANTTYLFSAWGMTENANGTNAPAVRVVELDENKKWIKQTNLVYKKGTNDWTQKNISFTTDINASWFYVYANIWEGYGIFWFDDVELYEDGTDTNLILDPGIEYGYVMKILPGFEKILHS